MAENIRFTLTNPAVLIFSSITEKSAPRTVANAVPKFSGTFGIVKEDLDLLVPLMVAAITAECGGFSGNPNDYYLACMSSKTAIERTRATAELNCMGKAEDEAFKIREKSEKRCAEYAKHAGILSSSSQFDVELAKLENGKIVDIKEPHAIAQAGKDLFFSGAYVVPSISLKGFRRKTLDAKDGVTSYLQNVLFIRKGPKLELGGGGPDNQQVFGGFQNYSDYDPLAMAPGAVGTAVPPSANVAPPVAAVAPPFVVAPPAPGRPADPTHVHDNGNGTEQWYLNGAWDGGAHPKGGTPAAPANFIPPAPSLTTSTTMSPSDANMW